MLIARGIAAKASAHGSKSQSKLSAEIQKLSAALILLPGMTVSEKIKSARAFDLAYHSATLDVSAAMVCQWPVLITCSSTVAVVYQLLIDRGEKAPYDL